MESHLIDLRCPKKSSHVDLPGLQAYLAQLVSEPFRFARVSYGDELTLHFGVLRPARSPKRKHKSYGAYILGLRASPWILKSGSERLVVAADGVIPASPPAFGRPLSKEESTEDLISRSRDQILGSRSPAHDAGPLSSRVTVRRGGTCSVPGAGSPSPGTGW